MAAVSILSSVCALKFGSGRLIPAAGAWSHPVLPRALIALVLIAFPERIDAQESKSSGDILTADPDPAATSLVVRGLSWDIGAGGVPRGGALFEAQLGFSGLPRLAYHYTLRRGFSVGGLVALDLGWWSPTRAVRPGLVFAVPLRTTLYRDARWSVGFRAEPGLLFDVKSDLVLGLTAPVSLAAGLTVEDRFIVGLAIDGPAGLLIPTGGGSAVLGVPLLGGPTAEFHLTPPLALTFEAKFGPWWSTSGTDLAVRVLLGAAYRL